MPYITGERRKAILGEGGAYIDIREVESVGELNFAITMLCKNFLENDCRAYRSFNKIIGVLECVKQEFYRKAVVPYEEEKEQENGSVY